LLRHAMDVEGGYTGDGEMMALYLRLRLVH
jgi:hypothetical protein